MGRHVWSEEVKAEALVLLADPEKSFYDVHKDTSVPVSTLHHWASAAGLTGHSNRLEETEAARKFRSERIALKRAVIAEKYLDQAETLADRSGEVAEGLIEVKEGVFIATGSDSLAYMKASLTALSSFRLEMGEPTQHTRSEATGAAEAARQRVDDLAERRAQKTA